MKYYLVICPEELQDSLTSESKGVMKKIYGKETNGIYYRVKTKDKMNNPRRLFIKGDGRVLEAELMPHIALVHNIELEDIKDFVQRVENVCKKHKPINLLFSGTGNYGMNFTFFVGFTCPPALKKLHKELLKLSKSFMSDDEYEQQISTPYIPHATILYDDIDPENVNSAYKLFDAKKFKKPVIVKEIILWNVSPSSQKIETRFKLGH